MSYENLISYFPSCVALYKHLKQDNNVKKELKVTALRPDGGASDIIEVEYHYYNEMEWRKFTRAQKKKFFENFKKF